jgi:hypothetical protein
MPIRPCNEDAGANLRGDPLQLPAGIAAFMGHLFGGTYFVSRQPRHDVSDPRQGLGPVGLVCTENLIRVDGAIESPKLAE